MRIRDELVRRLLLAFLRVLLHVVHELLREDRTDLVYVESHHAGLAFCENWLHGADHLSETVLTTDLLYHLHQLPGLLALVLFNLRLREWNDKPNVVGLEEDLAANEAVEELNEVTICVVESSDVSVHDSCFFISHKVREEGH